MLSPPINLYFKGEKEHQSIPSAILTVIAYALVFAATIYYFLGFINKDSPKAYFFTRYIEDAGYYPVNASSMFNYVQFIDKFDSTKLGFDFKVLRAVGVNKIYYEQYMDNPDVISGDEYSFWIYGPCNKDSDIKGIEDLIDPVVYQNAACIREYYDKDKRQYYKTGESGFIWPVIEKGCSNPESTFYGIIVQRCDKAPARLKERSYLEPCGDSTYITDAITKLSFKYQIIDHFADMLNYEMPFTKYFYEVASAVSDGIFIVNHLNFNPADMLTHNGIFFDNQVREPSYFFTQNEKHTMDQALLSENNRTTNGCLMGVYFWMQNTLQHYERNYDRFQDLLSDIGGIASIITTLGYFINMIINSFVTLLDTEELIINRDEMNFGDEQRMKRRPTFLKKVNQMEYPPKKQPSKTSDKNASINNSKRKLDDYKEEDIDIYNNNKLPRNKDNRINKVYNEKNQESMEMENMKSSTSPKTNKVDTYIRKENREKESNANNNTYIEYDDSGEIEKSKESRDRNLDKDRDRDRGRYRDDRDRDYRDRDYRDRDRDYRGRDRDRDYRDRDRGRSNNRGRDRYRDRDRYSENEDDIRKQNFNWFKYVWYLICCGTNDKNISYYEDIRATLISEENIIQNYLDIYQLLKLNKINRKDIFSSIGNYNENNNDNKKNYNYRDNYQDKYRDNYNNNYKDDYKDNYKDNYNNNDNNNNNYDYEYEQ